MKIIFPFIIIFFCSFPLDTKIDEKSEINAVINQWHKAAADAKYHDYFNLMTDDAVFIGTDATENWNRREFETYSKPHFDKGKAWTFLTLERNIYIDKSNKMAWFDELLDTSFKICRGSGVLEKINGKWKIKHYVLSMTVPNETSKEVIAIKDSIESSLIRKLKQK